MAKDNRDIQEALTEYLLGMMDPEEATGFEDRIEKDPSLAKQAEALKHLLHPLTALAAPEPPENMVDRIMARVVSTSPLEYVAHSTHLNPVSDHPSIRRSNFSLLQFVAVAACIAFLATVFVPGVASLRSRRMQALCAGNMASLGQGLSQYAMAHNGYLPSVGTSAQGNWLLQPNRQHLMPALRLRFVVPRALLCPTDEHGNIDNEQALQNLQSFLRNSNLRFTSTQNMNGPVPRMTARLTMPLAADANPMFEGGRFQPLSKQSDNSQAHGGRGQNVLFMDGSTQFLPTPLFGQKDNIWRAGQMQDYTGTEIQDSATDAFLIP